MLVDGTQVNIPAGTTVNVILGRPIEMLGVPTQVQLFMVADSENLTAQWLTNIGGNQMAPISSGQPVNTASVVGAGPKFDEDIAAVFAVPAGGRSQLNVTNPNAAVAVFRWRAILT